MNLNKLVGYTKYLIMGTVFIWIVYDFWVFDAAEGNDATISAQLIEWFYAYPLLPFLMGIIFGHLLWGKKSLKGKDN